MTKLHAEMLLSTFAVIAVAIGAAIRRHRLNRHVMKMMKRVPDTERNLSERTLK